LSEAGLPRKVLVASVRRDGETIFPSASTRLEVGDVLTVLADPAHEEALRQFFDSSPEPA
jgi:Trk K+ transport system NAD-binding subunit